MPTYGGTLVSGWSRPPRRGRRRGGRPVPTVQEQEILSTLCEAGTLPTIPAGALSIVRLSQDPDVTIEKLAQVLEKDPALAAKTLRFANSSYYRGAKPVGGLPQALVRLGIRGAKLLALSFGLVGACKRPGLQFDFPPFWQRCLTTAITSRRIATRSAPSTADQAFVGALLADLGCPLLARKYPHQYKSVAKLATVGPKPLCDIEQSFLGISHPVVSSTLLRMWQLPEDLTQAVLAHHDVSALPRDGSVFPVAATIMAASELTDLVMYGSTPERINKLASMFRRFFAFSTEHVDLLLNDLEPEIVDIGRLLDLQLPPLQFIQAEAKKEVLRLAVARPDKADTPAAQEEAPAET